MTIQVRQNLILPSLYNVKCPYTMTPEYITLHNTYNDASADNEIKYMLRNGKEVSFHIAVDDIESVQGIPLDRNAWAAGDGGKGTGNRKSIHIEICYSLLGGEKYKKAESNALKLTAQLLKERGWGIDRVKKHEDWSGKHCPHRILDEGRWENVLAQIQKELNALSQSVVKPTKATKTIFLPATADTWRVYPVDKVPIKTNAVAMLKPSKFGGLSYAVVSNGKEPHTYIIDTANFGRVKIYGHPSTGAVIK